MSKRQEQHYVDLAQWSAHRNTAGDVVKLIARFRNRADFMGARSFFSSTHRHYDLNQINFLDQAYTITLTTDNNFKRFEAYLEKDNKELLDRLTRQGVLPRVPLTQKPAIAMQPDESEKSMPQPKLFDNSPPHYRG